MSDTYRSIPLRRIAVAGGFDPIHEGHLDHLEKAAKLKGKYGVLIVILARDDQLVAKKGYCFLPFETRRRILSHFDMVDEIVPNIDHDTCCAVTLEVIKPTIFAKGGDRTPENMPKSEIEMCERIGCQIVYGVGSELASSQDYVAKLLEQLKCAIGRPKS